VTRPSAFLPLANCQVEIYCKQLGALFREAASRLLVASENEIDYPHLPGLVFSGSSFQVQHRLNYLAKLLFYPFRQQTTTMHCTANLRLFLIIILLSRFSRSYLKKTLTYLFKKGAIAIK